MKSKDEIKDIPSSSSSQESEGTDFFLEIVIGTVETFLKNSFDVNLMVTGIITQFLCNPEIRILEYLLDPNMMYDQFPLSFYAILSKISGEIVSLLQRYFYYIYFLFYFILFYFFIFL